MTTGKLVSFDKWVDPIAEEILKKEPWIELLRLKIDDPPDKVLKAPSLALSSGRLAGAGLDARDAKPAVRDHPLFKLDDGVVTPHNAGVIKQAYRALAEGAARQWITILGGGKPPRLQNAEVWPRYEERYRRICGEALAV